jgi:hypothetical protein
MKATIVAAICGCVVLGFAADSWSATQHARPYEYGPLKKCLSRKGFYYIHVFSPVDYPGLSGENGWRTHDKHDITMIVMITPARARWARHRAIADLAFEWHRAKTKISPGVGRRGNVVWENFRTTTSASPPVPTTPKDLATLVACMPPK